MLSALVIAGALMLVPIAGGEVVQLPSVTSEPGATPAVRPLKVVVTIPPLKGLVEPLLPKGSTVEVLIPPGASEHGYEIPPAMLAATASADLVVSIGLGLEPQVEKMLKDKPRAGRAEIRAAAVLGLDKPGAAPEHKHEHPPGGATDHDHCDHADDAADPHVWLDPVHAKALAVHAAGVLRGMGAAPSGEALTKLVRRIQDVGAAYTTTLRDAPRREIVVAHDAYGHLARRYRLGVIALAGLNAGEPKPADIKRASEVIRAKGLTTIFVEPQLSRAAAERLAAALGVKVAVLDPLGDGDWFKLMEKNLAAVAASLGVSVRGPAIATPPAGATR